MRTSPKLSDCAACSRKAGCIMAPQRMIMHHLNEDGLIRMHLRATPDKMRRRRCAG